MTGAATRTDRFGRVQSQDKNGEENKAGNHVIDRSALVLVPLMLCAVPEWQYSSFRKHAPSRMARRMIEACIVNPPRGCAFLGLVHSSTATLEGPGGTVSGRFSRQSPRVSFSLPSSPRCSPAQSAVSVVLVLPVDREPGITQGRWLLTVSWPQTTNAVAVLALNCIDSAFIVVSGPSHPLTIVRARELAVCCMGLLLLLV